MNPAVSGIPIRLKSDTAIAAAEMGWDWLTPARSSIASTGHAACWVKNDRECPEGHEGVCDEVDRPRPSTPPTAGPATAVT